MGEFMTSRMNFAAARRVACGVVLAAAFAGTAAADQPGAGFWLYDRAATTPLQAGQFYAGVTFNAGVQHLPNFNGSASLFSTVTGPTFGANVFSPEVVGVQPGGEIGFVFRDGTFPAFIGSRVRAAVYGSYSDAEHELSSSRGPGAANAVIYNRVDGTFLATVGLPAGSSLSESLKVQRESFQIGLKLESDVALAPNLSLTPAIAVFGGRTYDSYVHTSIISNFVAGFDAAPTSINERLRTREFGGHLGARLTWQFQPGWALHVGGTAGPVWLRTRMTASDCHSFVVVAPGAPCGPSNGAFLTASASDSRSTIAFRGTATVGLAVDARIAVISIAGFGRYDSRIPGIENPQQNGITATAATLAPARIRFQDGFAYGGTITVRMAFGL
jgi:hypothetical protein